MLNRQIVTIIQSLTTITKREKNKYLNIIKTTPVGQNTKKRKTQTSKRISLNAITQKIY